MIASRGAAAWPARGRHYARLVRGYVISRRLPGYWLLMLVLLGMVAWGGGWGQEHAPTTLQLLVFLLPVATAAVVGVSLWSPFGETERAAGTWLPLGRALHLATMLVFALAVNAVALATWVPVGDSTPWGDYLLRHTLVLTGIALLAARVVDSRLSWIVPALVAMPGLVMGYVQVKQAEAAGREVEFFQGSWHVMLQPHDSALAAAVSVVVFASGVVATTWRGERVTEPEAAAG